MRNLLIILIAGILLSGLAWYFIGGHTNQPATMQTQSEMSGAAGSAGTVTCPVTGGKIEAAKAYAKTVYKGKTYYFCCAGCPEEFKKNPEKYAK
ncbi:hypothetical protein A3H38_02805 [candidate division WOR-1 bacterium RIFCSPLOWO2_02_FULL_46_20]|uniref:TRASH domain-containing protein n=2 Tax=Saganbacteria TaxID=1703751 RepID=A0A1F4R8U7_UNCSA|nr:MAG: hypothetical protein A3H38_02805 [candidate division WOR-1 bacterium RIFCSPLOWO2_02_FULL_46_20]OGC08829.1 MAG: hypothetical protein A3F86_00045 [candidate division WOR-1 bacterium RIFCSPLOWO2_12_FULL_45_9]